ncbi:MAG: hypothetical protein BWX50_01391 [Euryarchaeota archaeon ADurb.Bin009]|nr:MAG: hypothetical protein BWX50_01391 [Euryarchaeota archaeon ADurb.Bin009]
MIWLETSTDRMPRNSIIVAWISMPASPRAAWVPTAPVRCPTTTRGRIWRSRSMWRATSLAQMANRRP